MQQGEIDRLVQDITELRRTGSRAYASPRARQNTPGAGAESRQSSTPDDRQPLRYHPRRGAELVLSLARVRNPVRHGSDVRQTRGRRSGAAQTAARCAAQGRCALTVAAALGVNRSAAGRRNAGPDKRPLPAPVWALRSPGGRGARKRASATAAWRPLRRIRPQRNRHRLPPQRPLHRLFRGDALTPHGPCAWAGRATASSSACSAMRPMRFNSEQLSADGYAAHIQKPCRGGPFARSRASKDPRSLYVTRACPQAFSMPAAPGRR